MNSLSTIQDIRQRIEEHWDKKPRTKLDWLQMEMLLVDILRLEGPAPNALPGTPDFRIALAKEALDAFTHRGHFSVSEYASSNSSTVSEYASSTSSTCAECKESVPFQNGQPLPHDNKNGQKCEASSNEICDAVRDMERPSRACDLPAGHEGAHRWNAWVGLFPGEDPNPRGKSE